MKARSIIAAILLTIGLLACFSATASMDAGASWVSGAVRGAVGIICLTVCAVLGSGIEVAETEDDNDISEWRDAL